MRKVLTRIQVFRHKYLTNSQFIYLLAILIGLLAGVLAVVMKNLVHFFHQILDHYDVSGILKGVTPIFGVVLTVFIAYRILNVKLGHGIPKVLYAISRKNGALGRKSILTSSLFSVLTVGAGGSAGLEGPSAAAGAAIGSKLSRSFHLEFNQVLILIGCGSSAAIAAIFNTPIAAILFSLEILMLDLTISSIIPLLISSVTGITISYFFLGQETIYNLSLNNIHFHISHIPVFVILGIIAGLNASVFSKIYLFTEAVFEKVKSPYIRVLTGGILLYILYFFFPATWGEGYEIINMCIENDTSFLYANSFFANFQGQWAIIILLFLIIFIKTFTTNITFGMGGVGGIFAPSLYIGAITGLLASYILQTLGYNVQVSIIVLVAMSGFMTGILHAPLTGIFLIAETTKSYELMVPLIITSVIAYLISKKLIKHSVYTFELAKRNELFTHDKNKSVLAKIDLLSILEKDFKTLSPSDSLIELIEKIKKTKRNVFPVTDKENFLLGVLTLEDAKQYIFNIEDHKDMTVKDIMYPPSTFVSINESTENIVKKIHTSGRYNIPVLRQGKYLGFVSRARIFSMYQKEIEKVSNEE